MARSTQPFDGLRVDSTAAILELMISIRPAHSEDLDVLRSLDVLAHDDRERRELISSAVADRNCYVALSESEVIGYGVLNYAFYRHGWIELVYVGEHNRRRGVGKALLKYMEAQCRTSKLFTSTNLSNLPMQRLLMKLGYTVSGIVDNLDDADPEIVYFKRRN